MLTKKSINFAQWTGIALFAIGSIAISVYPNAGLVAWPFVLFLIGHLLWAISGIALKDKAIITLNVVYLPFDVYATVLRI